MSEWTSFLGRKTVFFFASLPEPSTVIDYLYLKKSFVVNMLPKLRNQEPVDGIPDHHEKCVLTRDLNFESFYAGISLVNYLLHHHVRSMWGLPDLHLPHGAVNRDGNARKSISHSYSTDFLQHVHFCRPLLPGALQSLSNSNSGKRWDVGADRRFVKHAQESATVRCEPAQNSMGAVQAVWIIPLGLTPVSPLNILIPQRELPWT